MRTSAEPIAHWIEHLVQRWPLAPPSAGEVSALLRFCQLVDAPGELYALGSPLKEALGDSAPSRVDPVAWAERRRARIVQSCGTGRFLSSSVDAVRGWYGLARLSRGNALFLLPSSPVGSAARTVVAMLLEARTLPTDGLSFADCAFLVGPKPLLDALLVAPAARRALTRSTLVEWDRATPLASVLSRLIDARPREGVRRAL